MKVTAAQLRSQYERANEQWPWIHAVNESYGLPPFTMHALGSRETGLTNVVSKSQQDWGVWQRNIQHGIPDGWMGDVRGQCEWSAKLLASNVKRCGDLVGGCNAYNSGSCATSDTTGKDYGPDVVERREWLEANIPELWHPRAKRIQPADGHEGYPFIGVAPKVVLHTTESYNYYPSTANYFGNPYWPHSTITQTDIFQHLPINVSAYALAHEYAPETNRANAIQCEIVWRAANRLWPEALLAQVVDWVGWVQTQLGIPTVFAEMFREGITVASVDSPLRFSPEEWLEFSGICGHSNVPGGNDHWDPGRLPVERLQALLSPTPTFVEGALPVKFTYIYNGEDWVYLGTEGYFGQLPFGEFLDKTKKSGDLRDYGKVGKEFHQGAKALADRLGFVSI